MYENGIGVQIDSEKSSEYYKLGEQYLFYEEFYEIGRMYEYGFNVEKDINTALKYYSKARKKNSLSILKINSLSNNSINEQIYVNMSMNCEIL